MTTDDEAARRARAEALRKRMDERARGPAAAPAPPPRDESPLEFVNRRMRELGKPPRRRR